MAEEQEIYIPPENNKIKEKLKEFIDQVECQICLIMIDQSYSIQNIIDYFDIKGNTKNKFEQLINEAIGQVNKGAENQLNDLSENIIKASVASEKSLKDYCKASKSEQSQFIEQTAFRQSKTANIILEQESKLKKRWPQTDLKDKCQSQLTKFAELMFQGAKTFQRKKIIESIITTNNTELLQQNHNISQSLKNKFEKILKFSNSFNKLKQYGGNDIFSHQKKTYFKLLNSIGQVSIDYQFCKQLSQILLKNPAFNFMSMPQISNVQKKKLYQKIWKTKMLNEYAQINQFPKSLKQRVKADINKLLKQLADQYSIPPKEIIKTQKILWSYNLQEFFNIPAPKNMKAIYNYMKQNCLSYFESIKQKERCLLQMELDLRNKLRQKLFDLEITFDLWEEVETSIFAKDFKRLGEIEGISKSKKKALKEYTNLTFNDYYDCKYKLEPLSQRLKADLEKRFINLELDTLPILKKLRQIIGLLIQNPCQATINKCENLNPAQKRQIINELKNSTLFQEYQNNDKVDIDVVKVDAAKELEKIFNVIEDGPDYRIQQLFIQEYLKNPSKETIKKFRKLTEEHKQLIKKEISKNKILNQLQKSCQTISIARAKNNYFKLIDQQLQNKKVGKPQRQTLKEFIGRFCQVKFDEEKVLIPQIPDKQTFTELFDDGRIFSVIQSLQSTPQFQQFKKSFLESSQKQNKKIEQQLEHQINQILETFSVLEKDRLTILRDFKIANYSIEALQQFPSLQKSKSKNKIFKGIENCDSYEKIRESLQLRQHQQSILEELKLQKQLRTTLEQELFDRLNPSQKIEILDTITNKGVEGLEQLKYLTENDKEALRSALQLINNNADEGAPIVHQKPKKKGKSKQQIINELDTALSKDAESFYFRLKQSHFNNSNELAKKLLQSQTFEKAVQSLEMANRTQKKAMNKQITEANVSQLLKQYKDSESSNPNKPNKVANLNIKKIQKQIVTKQVKTPKAAVKGQTSKVNLQQIINKFDQACSKDLDGVYCILKGNSSNESQFAKNFLSIEAQSLDDAIQKLQGTRLQKRNLKAQLNQVPTIQALFKEYKDNLPK